MSSTLLTTPAPFCFPAEPLNFSVWHKSDPHYPPELNDLSTSPDPLYTLGSPASLTAPRVSIVGTRSSTGYGERVTRLLTRTLVRAGVSIVSGMARGIDGIAHRTALEEAGRTVAVLGTGIDVPYPAGHRQLHRMIVEKGLVLSENPPGMKAHQGAFPKRNRIIAALSPVTIVVEAGLKSGALNTATQALDLGRVVAAVPGPIDSEQSIGSNALIRDGAVAITSPGEALALLGISTATRDSAISFPTEARDLPESARRLWELLSEGPVDADGLSARSRLALSECLSTISALEIRGLVEISLAGEVRRR